MRPQSITVAFALLASTAVSVSAQTPATGDAPRKSSIAFEADVLAYGVNGYSAMLNYSFANGFQVAAGTGSYDVPAFLLEGDKNYEAAHWKARSTSVQVVRATYRFNGPMRSGFAVGAVMLNQNWKLSAEKIAGETKFRPVGVGLTAGYYKHFGRSFYVYPTTAFTYNSVASGSTRLGNTSYSVAKLAPNASLHMGWAWSR